MTSFDFVSSAAPFVKLVLQIFIHEQFFMILLGNSFLTNWSHIISSHMAPKLHVTANSCKAVVQGCLTGMLRALPKLVTLGYDIDLFL